MVLSAEDDLDIVALAGDGPSTLQAEPPITAHLRALASSITLAAMCGGSSS